MHTTFLQRIRAGVAPAVSDLSSFKRILFEAQTLMVHHLKSAVKGDDISVKKMTSREGCKACSTACSVQRIGYYWTVGACTCKC